MSIPAPRGRLLPERVAGHRVGLFGAERMLYAEGHPAEGRLAKPGDLPPSFEQVVAGLQDRGILPPSRSLLSLAGPGGLRPGIGGSGFGGVRRLDSTVNLTFDDSVEGLAALTGVAALTLPRVQTKIHREVGGHRVETVYMMSEGGKRVLGRWYDKGNETGEAPRGQWVRPEDQRRFTSQFRPTVESVASSTLVRDAFVQRFTPLWKAASGVRVGGMVELAAKLRDLQDEGLITPGQAERIAGFMVLDASEAARCSRATSYRRRAELRSFGLVLADGILDQVDVDLADILEDALEADCWGVG